MTAIGVINSKGIENATFENIGKAAGYPKSQIAYHFPKKEFLMQAMMEFIIKGMQSTNSTTLKGLDDPTLKVESIIRNTFTWARQNPDQLGAYLSCYKLCGTHPKLQSAFAMATEIGLARIYDSLEKASKRKRISTKSLMQSARAIRSLMVGSIFDFYASHSMTDTDSFQDLENNIVMAAKALAC